MDEWGRTSSSSCSESNGPFFSNPLVSQILFSSPSLSPPILSHNRVPPSTSSAIESSSPVNDDSAKVLSHNRLQFLTCPAQNSVMVFFPTGTNLDQIGFLLLSTGGDSGGLQVTCSGEGAVFVAKERFFSPVLKILVQSIKSSSTIELGYVLLYTLYSVHWYSIEYRGTPFLRYLGAEQFKTSIASVSWSPHHPRECLALLVNGDIFLFDSFKRCKLEVSWETQENSTWLGCEFGGKLGMFIVANSDAVFVITKSSGNCSVRSLLQVDSIDMDKTHEFIGFAKAGSDSFRFLLASRSCMFLCDQRSRLPLLKWEHDVEKPSFLDVYDSLSDLGVTTHESASCVIIGSFWNAQSQMFCYGPSPPSSLGVWELPHNLLLPAGKCPCGDCTIRELRMKESVLEWIDWQHKRVLVLGFGVLNKYLRPLGSLDQSSGFTLIRLTSSGKLEAVKFHASCDTSKSLQVVAHIDPAFKSDEVNLLYLPDDNEYNLPKRFKYLELEYLSAHAKGILAELLDSKMKTKPSGLQKKKLFSLSCHEELCQKLKICGFGIDRSSSTITTVFNNINSPTSVYDIALRETWSILPRELLMLAFSTYSEFADVWVDKKESRLDFLAVPEFPQLPPFFLRKPSSRSSKWSKKEQPGVELVGPVLPLPVLLTLHEVGSKEFSAKAELSNRCSRISKEMCKVTDTGVDETTIPLCHDDIDDDVWLNREKKPFIGYSPITLTADPPERQHQEQEKVITFVSRVRGSKNSDDNDVGGRAGLEAFDDMSPVELFFEERSVNCNMKAMFRPKALLSQWQRRSSPYKDFLSHHHQLR